MRGLTLLLKWSWRDLRSRWVLVSAIALVIAIGTGAYAGLSSLTEWRRLSSDASYAALDMHDLRVELSPGSLVPEGTLTSIARGTAHGSAIAAMEERLIVDSSVDASTAEQAILVPGVIIGTSVARGAPLVDGYHVEDGRTLSDGDSGQPVALLERHFAETYDLPPEGHITVAGGTGLSYVGTALTPEFFIVIAERGGFLSEANYAAVFTSLATAQQIAGSPGAVNDLVITLVPGTDRAQLLAELETAFASDLPDTGIVVTTREQDPAYDLIYGDIEGDQQFYDIFAGLIIAGALLAAFNLTTRIVEAQRREFGLAMALGVPRSKIAIRPLLVGAQIALLGVLFGIGVGALIGQALGGVVAEFFPLPVWNSSFQWRIFALAGLLGFCLPFFATIWPVWRVVRLSPVAALRPRQRGERGGLAPIVRRLPLPGNTFAEIPVRNILREPRRTLLTALGIAAVITVVTGFGGMLDSFAVAIGEAERETLATTPDRVDVELDAPYPVDSPAVEAVTDHSAVGTSVAALRVEGLLRSGTEEIGINLELLPLGNQLWSPTITMGNSASGRLGIIISEEAARDLGIVPGDVVTMRHPRRAGPASFSLVETDVEVVGLHPHPFRFLTYMDIGQAGLLGMEGTTNLIHIEPEEGRSVDDVKAAIFGLEGVIAVQPASAVTDQFNDAIGQFLGIFRIIQAFILVLALLIAFNSASINIDERIREYATMFAFGVRIRTVLWMAVAENAIIGLLSTLVGLAGGLYFVRTFIAWRAETTFEEFGIVGTIGPLTALIAVGLGVFAVAVAPLFAIRRLRNLDIAGALKIIE